LTLAYKGVWPVLSVHVSSSYQQCTVSVIIIAELALSVCVSERDRQTDRQTDIHLRFREIKRSWCIQS